MRRGWSLGIGLLMACGDEPLPPAELGEVCGEAGPFRVLELEPGVRLTELPVAHDGRVVMRTGKFPRKEGQSGPPWPVDLAVWSTGSCGESPVRLDAAVRDVVRADRWPELLLGYRVKSRELVTLDVTGADGHVVFTGVGPSYPLYWTEHGLLTFEANGTDTGAALLHRYPEDPLAGTVTASELFAPVKVTVDDDRVYAQSYGQTAVVADDLFILGTDGTLVRVALVDGEVIEERTGVKTFAVSPDGRWLAWQALTDDPEDFEGPVFLRDRSDGGEIGLGDLRLGGTFPTFRFYAEGLMTVDVTGYINTPQRVYTLATLEFVELPPERKLTRVLADGQWALDSYFAEGVDLFDPKDSSVTRLIARGSVRWWGEDDVEVIDVAKCCYPTGSDADEGALFRVSLTGETRELASRASRISKRLTDGRWITGLDLDDDFVGQLALIEPVAAESSRIDDRVFPSTAGMSSAFGEEEVLVYSVDDGARTGVWVANLGEE